MSKRLRTAREDAELSIAALAALTGIAPRTIAYYEDPKYIRRRKLTYVTAWATATDRTVEELWGNASEQPSARTGCLRGTADLAHLALAS